MFSYIAKFTVEWILILKSASQPQSCLANSRWRFTGEMQVKLGPIEGMCDWTSCHPS